MAFQGTPRIVHNIFQITGVLTLMVPTASDVVFTRSWCTVFVCNLALLVFMFWLWGSHCLSLPLLSSLAARHFYREALRWNYKSLTILWEFD